MSDYGIRISADGIDVKTGADKDMVLTSKYSMLKGTLSGSGTVEVPRDATTTTVTIAHGLGYIPMAQAFLNVETIFNPGIYAPMPNFFFDGSTGILATVRADATNIYLDFSIEDF